MKDQYLIKGMTDLALEYNNKAPDFIIGAGRTDIWVIDDHNLIAKANHSNYEEWYKLHKVWDCWWLVRRKQEGKELSDGVLKPDDVNNLDDVLYGFLAEKEFLG